MPFVLVLDIISIIIFEFEFSSTGIPRETPRLTTNKETNKEIQL